MGKATALGYIAIWFHIHYYYLYSDEYMNREDAVMADDVRKAWKTVREQAEKVLGERFWHDIAGILPRPGPNLDLYETSTHVVAAIELPGLRTPDRLRLSTDGRSLMIRGEIHSDYEVDDDELVLSERWKGRFQRSVRLPHEVEKSGIRARLSDGLLVVYLTKIQQGTEEDIPINVATDPPDKRG